MNSNLQLSAPEHDEQYFGFVLNAYVTPTHIREENHILYVGNRKPETKHCNHSKHKSNALTLRQ